MLSYNLFQKDSFVLTHNTCQRTGLEPLHILKVTVFWYIAPCNLIEIDRHFRDS